MQNKFYSLQKFQLTNTNDLYPVIFKGEIELNNKLIKVFIDTLSGSLIASENTTLRISGGLAADYQNCLEILKNKLDISKIEASQIYNQLIGPSVVNSSHEELHQFFAAEKFSLYTNIIQAEYKNGYSKGRTVLKHCKILGVKLSIDWSFIEGVVEFSKPEIIGLNTFNIDKNKYVDVLLQKLFQHFTKVFLNNSGKTVNENC